jgi:mRNA interferase RelE/StbE
MANAVYRVEITPHARKQLDKLPQQARERIETKIAALATDPRPPGSIKLAGTQNTYRIRVGMYRVIYEIHDAVLLVIVTEVVKRADAYK